MAQNQTSREKTTISLRYETREKLREHGNKGQSYDQILSLLLTDYEELCAAREQLREETGYYENDN